MATFDTSFAYILVPTGLSGQYDVVAQVPGDTRASADAGLDNTMTFDETINIDFQALNPVFDGPYTYIGHVEGITDYVATRVVSGATVTILFTNDEVIRGTTVTVVADSVPVCFLSGTTIACPDGEGSVETIDVGDLVLAFDGRAVPVKWIGRQTLSPRFGMTEGRRPVCVSAGALGNNLPVRDLRLTADHALLIDNVLVQAGALVNDTTVRRISPSELGNRFVVYHIETENHEVVLAEGAPAETFIDNVSRRHFDNYAEFESLYGDETPIVEQLDQPRAMSARQVPRAIRERLAIVARHVMPAAETAA